MNEFAVKYAEMALAIMARLRSARRHYEDSCSVAIPRAATFVIDVS